MMRFVDVLYGLPYLPFAIILLVILGSGIVPMLLALAIVGWLTASRLVRGQLLTLKQNEYVEAARALGAPRGRIIFRHLLPNTLGIIVVAMFLEIPGDDHWRGHPLLPGAGHLGAQCVLGHARTRMGGRRCAPTPG